MPLPINPDPYRAALPGEYGVTVPPPSRVGLDFIGAGDAAAQQARDYAAQTIASMVPPPPTPRGPAGPDIGISADGSQLYVQGRTFAADDSDNILRAKPLLNQPGTGRIPEGFRQLDAAGYNQLAGQIEHASGWELFKRNFGSSVDTLQQNIGRATQAFNEGLLGPMMPEGERGWGADMAEANAEEARKASGYARPWDTSSFGDWAAAGLGGLIPSVGGGLASGIAGGIAGTATLGPGPGTAIGAFLGATAFNYPLAVGDNAQHQIDANGKIDPGAAFAYGIPYAALESIPEVGFLGRATGRIGAAGLKPILGRGAASATGEVLRRVGVGGTIGALTEGATEAGQEAVSRASAGQDLWSPEAQAAYAENARLGALGGFVFGGGAHLFGGGHKPAPAQTGVPLAPGAPADLLGLPAPGAPNLPGGGGTRPGFWGSNQTGREVGPQYDPNVVDAEWSDVVNPTGLPPAGPRGLPPGPGGPLVLGGPAAQLQIAGPTDPDLFGGSRYTDPGTPPPTSPPAGGGGTGLSTAEFYNQTPMGQHIADQLIAEHTERAPAAPAPLPTSASGGTMADMLSALTGRATPDEQAAAAAQQRSDISNEAIAAAGQQAFEELGYQGQQVGRGGVVDFRAKAMSLLRGRGRAAAVEAPTHAALKDEFNATKDDIPPVIRKKLARQLNAPKLGAAKRAEIAAEIAKHKQPVPASHQPAGAPAQTEMAFGDSAGVRLKRGVGKAVKAVKAGAAKVQALGNRVGPQSREKLGDRFIALQGHMVGPERSAITLALRDRNASQETLARVAAKLDEIENEINTDTVPEWAQQGDTTTTPGAALRRGARGPAPALIQLGGAEPSVFVGTQRAPARHDPVQEAAIRDDLDSLPDSADEYTVMAAHKYLDENRYDNAAAFAEAARQGKAIGRFAMTPEEYAEQKAKQEYRREQTSADTAIEGGVDEAMANLQSAINDLGRGRGKKKAKLTGEQVDNLQGLVRGNSTVAQVRARTLAYLEANGHTAEALRNAERARTNKQAEAEQVGENAFKVTPEKLAEMADAINALHNKTGASAEAAAEAVAQSTITPTDEQAVLDKLTDEDKVTIGEAYEPVTGAFSGKAKRAFINDYNDTINKKSGYTKIADAIKAIIKRINAGVMAVAMVFNPVALSNVSPDFFTAPSEQAATRPSDPLPLVPAGVHMSDVSTLARERVSPTLHGRGLIIVDKPNGEIHFFGSKGEHITSGPVLTGLSKGDVLPEDTVKGGVISDSAIDDIPESERVTPAGIFTAVKRQSEHGVALRLVDAKGQDHQIAIHDTFLKDRLPRFTTSGVGDNMVSYGCVNISPEMYEATLKHDIDKFNHNVVVVIPHDISKAEAMLPAAQEQVAQQQAQAGDPYADYPVVANPDKSRWDAREDGSAKGDGWLGVRQRPDGGVSSEISAGVTIGGQQVEIPLMVPGLTKSEMDYLMTHDTDTGRNPSFFKDMPRTIFQKAVNFAKARMAEGKSPFRQADEATPYTDERRRGPAPLRGPREENAETPLREEDTRPSPVFSREDTTAFTGDGMSAANVKEELRKATKGWKAPPTMHIHENWNSIPEGYKARVSRTSKGFFDRTTGEVHIIASNIADAADVRSTLYHEALGHFGLWNRFTQRLGPMLVKMYDTNTAVRTEADKYLKFMKLEATPANIAKATEETLAEWFSEGAVNMSAWKHIKAYVRNMGRAMGMSVEYSNNDIASVMHKAQQYTMLSDGPVTYMDHNEAMGSDVLMRDWDVAGLQSKSPPWLRDLAAGRWTATRDAFSSGAQKGMLGNQLTEDYLPSLGVSKAKRVAALVRARLSMTNTLMGGSREWAAAMELEPLAWRRRSTGVGAPDINNFSGLVETGRRRGKWPFFPDDGRFAADDIEAAKERFYRGTFNTKGEMTEGPLIDPELKTAFDKMTPSQQKLVRDFYFHPWNAREQERSAFFETLDRTYDGAIADAKTAMDEAEYYAGLAQAHAERENASAADKSMAKKQTKKYAEAKEKHDTLVSEKGKAARELHNTYRDIEYTPYASMQRHGAFVIIGESKVLQAARAAVRAAKEAGDKYVRPEDEASLYAMEADPDHYFVHAVDNRLDAVRMQTELQGTAEFSGGRVVYGRVSEVGEDLFKGSDVIAGLQKIMGTTDVSGETQATNNIVLEIAKRAIIDAMSQNSAKKADKHFRNIRSAPLDMPKAFMSRMLSSSQFLSGHEHNAKIYQAMVEAMDQVDDPRYVSAKNRAKAKAGMLEFIGRYNDDMTPHSTDTMADVLTTASSVKMLILSPSYYVQQLAQNMLITAPHLTRWFAPTNIGSAFKIGYEQVHKAFSDTGEGSAGKGVLRYLSNGMLDISQIDPKYREMLRYLENMGLLDVSMNLEMGRVSSDVSSGRVDKFMRGVRNSVRGLESNNRIAAGIAAYHLMHAEGRVTSETISNLLGVDQKAFNQRYEDYVANHETMKKYADHAKEDISPPLEKAEFAAAEFARQVILDTHGDYSSSNKPVWTRRSLGRVATQFRTFNVMQIGTFIKTLRAGFNWAKTKEDRVMARRALMYMVGNTALFAGINGLPLMTALGWAYGVLAAGDDEPDRDYQKDIREWTGDATLANLILYGAPSLVGMNMSGSIGMGNMFSPVSGKDAPTNPDRANAYALALLLGPSASTLNSTADAYDLYFNKGQTYKAMQAVMPKALQGPIQAIHDSTVGEYTRNGIQLMKPEDISIFEKAWGVLGIQASERSARKWAIGRAIDEDQFFSSTGASIKRSFVEAKAAGDVAGVAEARENWMALQASRQRLGFKQQPISQLSAAVKKAATDTENVAAGIPYTGGAKGQALKLGQLAGQ